jgi:hypothetical protein
METDPLPPDAVKTPAPAAVPVPAAAPATPTIPPTTVICQRWWNDLIPGSPVGQHTPGYNHLLVAFEELKRRLIAGL